MSIAQLKSEILTLVGSTDNEHILSLVKQELIASQRAGAMYDPVDVLDDESLAELKLLAAEDSLANTISLDALKQNVALWRSK